MVTFCESRMDEISESAKAIQEVARAANQGIEASQHLGSFVARLIGEPLEVQTTKYIVAMNKFRLDDGHQLMRMRMYDDVSRDHGYVQVCMTAFGVSFVEACLGRGKSRPKNS
jgi:hypothetical protein